MAKMTKKRRQDVKEAKIELLRKLRKARREAKDGAEVVYGTSINALSMSYSSFVLTAAVNELVREGRVSVQVPRPSGIRLKLGPFGRFNGNQRLVQ